MASWLTLTLKVEDAHVSPYSTDNVYDTERDIEEKVKEALLAAGVSERDLSVTAELEW